jgi:manganese transport protein
LKKYLGVTLGIMTALGGFLDLGQIVFTAQAGAYFGYELLWAIVIGTAVIILYMEMCGRVAVVAHKPVFSVIRTCLGYRLGLFVLIASNLLNIITCAAELAGIAIVLHLITGLPEKSLIVISALALVRPLWPPDDRLCRIRTRIASELEPGGVRPSSPSRVF